MSTGGPPFEVVLQPKHFPPMVVPWRRLWRQLIGAAVRWRCRLRQSARTSFSVATTLLSGLYNVTEGTADGLCSRISVL